MKNERAQVNVFARLRTAAALLLTLRGRDFLSAGEFMKIAFPHDARPVQIAKFIVWAVDAIWNRIPNASAWAQIDQDVSHIPYWQTAPNPLANHPWATEPDARIPESAEVAVIGAGFGGSSFTYHWSKNSDKSLVLLEMRDPASGSAGRNGGVCVMAGGAYHGFYIVPGVSAYLQRIRPELSAEQRDAIVTRFAGVYVRALHASHEQIRATIAAEGIECDYARLGWIHVPDEADRPKLESSLALARRLGHDDWAPISAADIHARSGANAELDGAVSSGSATWHPAKWVWGTLTAALKNPSVRIFTRTAALRVERLAEGFAVHTDRGSIRARYVINASDSHTPQLFAEYLHAFPDLVTPYRVQAIYAEGGPPLLPKQVNVSNKLGFYARTRAGGVLFGTDHSRITPAEAGGNEPSRFITRLMCAEMGDQWDSGPTRVTHEWTGSVGVSPDWFPLIGPMDDHGLFILSGFAGAGSAVSFNGAQHLVHQILGKRCEPEFHPPEYFSPMRFRDPLFYGRPLPPEGHPGTVAKG